MEIKVYSIKLDSPRWLRRAVVYFAIPAAAILGVSAVVYANVVVPNEFSNGEVLDAEKMNANFDEFETAVNTLQDTVTAQAATIASQQAAIASLNAGLSNAAPPGSIVAYFGSTAPLGWLIADGSLVDAQATPNYAALVNHLRALGADYQGALSSQAKLPDLRGMFLRGQDRGANVNPESGADAIGKKQADALQGHGHPVYLWEESGGIHKSYQYSSHSAPQGPAGPATMVSTAFGAHAPVALSDRPTWGSPRTSSETRPQNTTVLYIIKY